MALLKMDTRALCLAVFVFMAMAFSSCHAARVECHQISPCSTVICGEQCTEVLGFKNPEILCIPANPPSEYYDTCCCRERENVTRTSLSK
ncbi:hypothetical protein C2845_PM04G07890 [Panicum miliaceum]|uniref:Uncharacterized protein n=1 Tax=Panicum miliaceum TaxID=4540 RepID=A0A3L6QU64_PANMI|nr:hypothetical protein C2845_PM04G07890 [Panicum miliaceum]